MIRPIRQSLLVRLLGTYLCFVVVVLGTGYAVNRVMQRQIQADVHRADLALAQAIALNVDATLRDARDSLGALSILRNVRSGDSAAMERAFEAFKAARVRLSGPLARRGNLCSYYPARPSRAVQQHSVAARRSDIVGGADLARRATGADGGGCHWYLTDNGPGIAPEELPHLFERFYRAAWGQQLQSSGVGLGSAICKAFVEAYGGRMWVESSEQGTTFAQPPALGIRRHGDLTIDLEGHTVWRRDEQVQLTPTEFALLNQLVLNPNKAMPHHTLLQRVWGREYSGEAEYLRVYIGRLRRKLEADPSNPRHLVTEPGIGYRFVP